jgi:hypothetical protein
MAFKLTPKSSGFKLKPKEIIDDMPPMDMPIEEPVPKRELTRTQQLTNVLGNILSGGGQKAYSETPTPQELEYEKQNPLLATAEVPLQMGGDILSAISAGAGTASDYLAGDGIQKPFGQRFQESAFQYAPTTEKSKKYYETFSENLGALPATSQFQTGARLTNLQKQVPKLPTSTEKFNKEIQKFVNKDYNQQLTELTKNAKLNKSIKESADAGYVFIPSQLKKSSFLDKTKESTVGTSRLSEAAQIKNQNVTNKLARKYLGVSENTVLDDTLLNNIRKKHGKVYQEVSELEAPKDINIAYDNAYDIVTKQKVIIPSATYRNGKEILEDLKEARFDSITEWSYFKRQGKPSSRKKAVAYDAKVDRLEKELENLAKSTNREDLLPALKNARKEIAKSYLVAKALNPVTGDIDAKVFTKLAYDKKLIDPNAQKIARFNKGFPTLSSVPKGKDQVPFTVLDVGISTYGAVTGKPMLAAPTLSKYLAKTSLFKTPKQQSMVSRNIEATPRGIPSLLQIPQVSPQRVIPSEQNIYRLGLGSLLAPLNE